MLCVLALLHAALYDLRHVGLEGLGPAYEISRIEREAPHRQPNDPGQKPIRRYPRECTRLKRVGV